jgi:hypothetical protein
MSSSVRAAWAAVGLVGALAFSTARAADAPAVDAKAAFARLKTLAGEWKVDTGHGGPAKTIYRVTSAGSAVMETIMAGTDHEMVSVYHLDGDNLVMTHYCAVGNQPRVKLDKSASTADKLVFAFDGGTNLDPAKDLHMHSGWINFLEGGKVEAEWEGYKDGKKAGTHKFVMTRQ